MAPLTLNLNGEDDNADFIYVGDTYTHQFTFEDAAGDPIDKSAKTFTAQIRSSRSSDTVVAAFAVVTSGVGNNIVTMTLTATITAALSVATYVWDIQETEGAVVTTIVTGTALVVNDVSQVV